MQQGTNDTVYESMQSDERANILLDIERGGPPMRADQVRAHGSGWLTGLGDAVDTRQTRRNEPPLLVHSRKIRTVASPGAGCRRQAL